MALREPPWWYEDKSGPASRLLQPVAAIYGAAAVSKYRAGAHQRAPRPLICIGNFTAGGAGKTPTVIALAGLVRTFGFAPWTLSRGYGGSLAGPVVVNADAHGAIEVGDEPLLLARCAAAVVSRDRRDGARFIGERAPRDAIILMDDGLQNGAVAKTFSIALVDRTRGFGNGRVIPAGPLRAPLEFQASIADAFLINGAPEAAINRGVADFTARAGKPILQAWTVVRGDGDRWRGRRVAAFAGIANPDRFFDLLKRLGADVVEQRAFPDHHTYSPADAATLLAVARAKSASLVTTEKDRVRLLRVRGALAELAAESDALAIQMQFAEGDEDRLSGMLRQAIAAH